MIADGHNRQPEFFFSYLMPQWISLFRSRATMSSPSIFHHSFYPRARESSFSRFSLESTRTSRS